MTQRVKFEAPHLAFGLDLNGEGRDKPYGWLAGGYAARYVRRSAIESGPGYRRIVDLSEALKVDTLHGSKAERLKTLWGKSGTKVLHSLHEDDTEYTVGLIRTASERDFFLEARNGDLFDFNQIDAPARIAVAALYVLCADNADVLNVGTGYVDKFTMSGTVYVNGVPVTYSGQSGGTLTGLSGVPAGGFAAGALVTQTSTPASMDIARGTCGMFLEGSMLIAGKKGFENVIYTSAPSDLDHPEYAWDFLDHGASAKIMDNPVVAMLKGETIGYIFGSEYAELTNGFDESTNILRTRNISPSYGAYNNRCVVNIGGRAVFMGGRRIMPVNIVLDNNQNPEGKLDEDFDGPIRPWIEQFDDDQGDSAVLQYDQNRGLISITGKIDGAIKTRVFDNRKDIKRFLPEEARPLRCHTFFDGRSYFGNNVTGRVYENHVGLTNDGFPILHQWYTMWMEAKAGRQEVMLDFLDFDGFMSLNCEFTVRIYVNGNETPVYTITFNRDSGIITSTVGITLGTRGVGVSGVGVGGSGAAPMKAYPYKAKIDLNGLTGESFRIDWTCSKLGAFLQTKSFIMEGDGVRFTSRDSV